MGEHRGGKETEITTRYYQLCQENGHKWRQTDRKASHAHSPTYRTNVTDEVQSVCLQQFIIRREPFIVCGGHTAWFVPIEPLCPSPPPPALAFHCTHLSSLLLHCSHVVAGGCAERRVEERVSGGGHEWRMG